MFDKLSAVESQYQELMARLGTTEVQSDPAEYRKAAKALPMARTRIRCVSMRRLPRPLGYWVRTISWAAQTGRIGDGKIFVSTIDTALRIRTGEKDDAAI